MFEGTGIPDQKDFIESGSRCGRLTRTSGRWKRSKRTISSSSHGPAAPAFRALFSERHWRRSTSTSTSSTRATGIAKATSRHQMINDQMKVLNNAYAGMGVRFKLDLGRLARRMPPGTRWPTARRPRRALKTALRQGTADDLNIYTAQHRRRPPRLGDLPVQLRQQARRCDGVVLLYSSLPGGSAAPYNLGDTGDPRGRPLDGPLPHVPGRLQATARRAATTSPTRRPRSRPPTAARRAATPARTIAGVDPITNFMDYTDDSCMDSFSAGQDSAHGRPVDDLPRRQVGSPTDRTRLGRGAAIRLLPVLRFAAFRTQHLPDAPESIGSPSDGSQALRRVAGRSRGQFRPPATATKRPRF